MNGKFILAVISITLALVFYTIGVFRERKSGTLKKSHVIIFWIGLVCDTIGTITMGSIANSGDMMVTGQAQYIHGITGGLAIILMLFHAVWASFVIYKDDEKTKKFFHKFSIVVWLIWLIPYFVGMFVGMSH
ncbi:MAG: HsmA family protein [Clostridium sp.]